ncbi:MAG: aminotransferase class I/II-fold pyridoxal phosphate-dependent enzyme [Tissierellia bacterium]|jgi:methionine-gamma-lyase|nr:aminotransferase class I/II-fold pyridoxal phosphate-dependent enzyme [Tissierellia bacterium]
MENNKLGLQTRLLHEAGMKDEYAGAHVSPIYQTTTYVFDDIDQAIYLNQHQDEGFTYTRFGSPTQAELEAKIAKLENAEAALAVGSGMAAITTALLTSAKKGGHMVVPNIVYGCTFTFFDQVLPKYGIEVTYVEPGNLEEIKNAIKENTTTVYVETPANPTLNITDIEEVAKITKEHGLTLIVDSTFASPALQNPLDLGADVVVHSATKYLCGHGTVVAGVLAGTKKFIDEARFPVVQTLGQVLSPFDAWLLMIGMKTLGIRMERHCENGMKVAEYLNNHPLVDKVYYPGLESHPSHEVAKKQMRGYGGMMSFDIKGGIEAGKIFMNSVKIFSLATSLGNIDSLVQHSPTMSHFDMSREEREAVGIKDGQVRVSVGIENIDDLIADLEQALEKVKEGTK